MVHQDRARAESTAAEKTVHFVSTPTMLVVTFTNLPRPREANKVLRAGNSHGTERHETLVANVSALESETRGKKGCRVVVCHGGAPTRFLGSGMHNHGT